MAARSPEPVQVVWVGMLLQMFEQKSPRERARPDDPGVTLFFRTLRSDPGRKVGRELWNGVNWKKTKTRD